MKTIPLEDWEKLSVQDRNEKLAELNSKPSLFQLFIMVLLKKMEGKKPAPLLDTVVFKGRRNYFK